MFILQCFWNIVTLPFRLCQNEASTTDQPSAEATPLIQERSASSFMGVVPAVGRGLTRDFTDFTHSKQMIRLCFANLAIYLVVGVVSFSFLFEKWSIVDSLYYSCVTFTTVGYGDIFPTTDDGRIFNIFFALYGIVILGLFIGLIGESIVDRVNEAQADFEKKARKQTIKMFGTSDDDQDNDDDVAEELDRQEQSILQFVGETILLEAPIVIIILLIAIGIGRYEGWSIVDALYYGVITSSTVGYGDISPSTPAMRIVCIFFIPITVAVFCEILGRIAGSYLERRTIRKEKEFLNRQLTRMDLQLMDVNQDGSVEWAEFLSFMLVAMQKVEPEDIDELREIFNKLDKTQNGTLEKEDLLHRQQEKYNRVESIRNHQVV